MDMMISGRTMVKNMNSNKEIAKLKVYEKHAWMLISALGVLTLVPGAAHALGVNTDPATAEGIVGMALSELKASNPSFFELYDFYFRFGGLSDLGFDWAFNSFDVLCEKFEHTAKRNFLDFEEDARREARIIILESIAIDNEAKKLVFGAEHSFGE